MTIIRVNTCQRCKHAIREADQGIECRRYPPQVNCVAVTMVPPGRSHPETVLQTIAAFPRVQPDSFCGEYAPALAIANDQSAEMTFAIRDRAA